MKIPKKIKKRIIRRIQNQKRKSSLYKLVKKPLTRRHRKALAYCFGDSGKEIFGFNKINIHYAPDTFRG